MGRVVRRSICHSLAKSVRAERNRGASGRSGNDERRTGISRRIFLLTLAGGAGSLQVGCSREDVHQVAAKLIPQETLREMGLQTWERFRTQFPPPATSPCSAGCRRSVSGWSGPPRGIRKNGSSPFSAAIHQCLRRARRQGGFLRGHVRRCQKRRPDRRRPGP